MKDQLRTSNRGGKVIVPTPIPIDSRTKEKADTRSMLAVSLTLRRL
jgi:hypothetical protein